MVKFGGSTLIPYIYRAILHHLWLCPKRWVGLSLPMPIRLQRSAANPREPPQLRGRLSWCELLDVSEAGLAGGLNRD